ncbi:MAG TPA: PKD domain-containing protein [Solirubrobacteraceae bacterium]
MRSLAANGVATVCALGALVALGIGAAPAAAVVANLGGHGYGITPITGVQETQLVSAYEARRQSSLSTAPLASPYDVGPLGGTQLVNFENGPVMHGVTTHVIYWDPNKEFTEATKAIVDEFFGDVAHDSGLPSNVFAVAAQYTDGTGNATYASTAATPQVDTDAFPPDECAAAPGGDPGPPYTKCLLDAGVQEELSRFITARQLPVGPTQLYLLLLPHRIATCLEEEAEITLGVVEQVCSNNFFCAYHSYIEPGTSGEIIYATIPFSLLDGVADTKGCQDDGHTAIQQPNPDNANGKGSETRFADVALKYISHEYIEAVTDPLVGVETAWVDARGLEIGDKCNGVDGPPSGEGRDPNSFLPVLGGLAAEGTLFNQAINTGHYYLQSEWDNAARACRMQPLSLGAGSFVAPSGTIAGVPASFTASAADAYGAIQPTWSFGDGASAAGVSVQHTYATAGEFTVTMTPRDRLTNTTGPAASHTIVVGAAPAPTPVAVAPPPAAPSAVASVTRRSTFAAATAVVDQKTGMVTLTTSVLDAGTFSFRATFPNGRFGAFASSVCRKPRIRLAGRCLPATIVYASGSKAFAAGRVRVTLRPSASGLKALRRALRQRRGVPVTLVLTFQSARGGVAFSRSQSLIVRPRR